MGREKDVSQHDLIKLNVVQVWCHPGGNGRLQACFLGIKINDMLHPVVNNRLFLKSEGRGNQQFSRPPPSLLNFI